MSETGTGLVRGAAALVLCGVLAACQASGGTYEGVTGPVLTRTPTPPATPLATMPGFGTTQDSQQVRTETLADGTVRTTTTTTSLGVSIGQPDPLAFSGNWRLASSFGKTCALDLRPVRAGSFYEARANGFCNMGFDKIAAWSPSGQNIVLLSAGGSVMAQLAPNGSGGYAGSFADGSFAPEAVTLSRANGVF